MKHTALNSRRFYYYVKFSEPVYVLCVSMINSGLVQVFGALSEGAEIFDKSLFISLLTSADAFAHLFLTVLCFIGNSLPPLI